MSLSREASILKNIGTISMRLRCLSRICFCKLGTFFGVLGTVLGTCVLLDIVVHIWYYTTPVRAAYTYGCRPMGGGDGITLLAGFER